MGLIKFVILQHPKEIEKIKKELCKIFCENDLKIMREATNQS